MLTFNFVIWAADASGMLKVWSCADFEAAPIFERRLWNGPIVDVDWDDDSERLFVVGAGSAAFNVKTGASVGSIAFHSQRVNSVCVGRRSSNRKLAFEVWTGSDDMIVGCFAGIPSKFVKSFAGIHAGFVQQVSFSPDFQKALSVASDKKIVLFRRCVEKSEGFGWRVASEVAAAHAGTIYGCAWTADSRHVLSVSADKTVAVWDTAASPASSSSDFKRIAAIDLKRQLVGISPSAHENAFFIATVESDLVCVQFDANKQASESLCVTSEILGHSVEVKHVTVAKDAEQRDILLSVDRHGKILKRPINTLAKCTRISTKESFERIFYAAKKHILFGVDLNGRLLTGALNADFSGIQSTEIVEDECLAVCALEDDIFWISATRGLCRRAAGASESEQLTAPTEQPPLVASRSTDRRFAMAAAGGTVAVAWFDGAARFGASTVRLYDRKSLRCVAAHTTASNTAIVAVALSSNGSLLAAGTQQRFVQLFAMKEDEACLQPLVETQWSSQAAAISGLCFGAANGSVWSASLDGSLAKANVPLRLAAAARIEAPVVQRHAHFGGVTSIASNSETGVVATGGCDGCICVWKNEGDSSSQIQPN